MSYTINEIIDIAIGLEESGYEFYTKCSTKFDNLNIKNIFSYLAEEELSHKEIFQSMLQKNDTASGIFTDEYFLYLKAIGGGRVFSVEAINNIISNIKTPIEAIKKALNDEKESILLYSEIKVGYKNDKKTSETLDKIISEERKHVLSLIDLLNSLTLSK